MCNCRTAAQVQQLAAAAVTLCEQSGGSLSKHNMMCKLSRLGCSGRYKGNCERDLQRLIYSEAEALDAEVEYIQVTLLDPKTQTETRKPFPIIFPDKMALAIFNYSEAVFQQVFLGKGVNAAKYWRHVRQHSKWIENHPAKVCKEPYRQIPLSLYGDEVQSFRNTEGGLISAICWSSDLAAGLAPLSRYFAICCVPDHYTTKQTFLDIWSALAERLNVMCSEECNFPWRRMGYTFTYSSTQGDLKWLNDKFQFHNSRSNDFCSICQCVKNHNDISMTLGDFREGATHRQTKVDHETFFANRNQNPSDYHPLFAIQGCRTMNSVHLITLYKEHITQLEYNFNFCM